VRLPSGRQSRDVRDWSKRLEAFTRDAHITDQHTENLSLSVSAQ